MLLLTFYSDGALRLGVQIDRGVIDVAAAARAADYTDLPATPDSFYADGLANLDLLGQFVAELQTRLSDGAAPSWLRDGRGLRLGPPVPRPGKILCVGLNYRSHAGESRMALPEQPLLFSKFTNALTGPTDPVALLPDVEQYDYEAEMVAVIGRRARRVAPEEALTYVLGYCNGNDLSARDLQFRSSQWLLGKTPDGFFPTGPMVVSAESIPDPHNLAIECRVNGELRQASNTRHMIFSVADIISYASRYMTLESGDLISTGTPEGVILGMEEKKWLRAGDEVSVTVERLGTLSNRLVAPNG